MIRRSPVIPNFFWLSVQVGAMAVTFGIASGIWSGSSHGGMHPVRLVGWCLATIFSAFGVCLSVPLFRWVVKTWDQRTPRHAQRWALFYGLFAVTGMIGGFTRNTLLHLFLPEQAGALRLILDMGMYAFYAVMVALLHDRITFFHQEIAAETQRIETEVQRVFLSRETLLKAKEQVDASVIQELMTRFEPDLDALDARMQEMVTGLQVDLLPTEDSFDDLMRQVDRLRDPEIRLLSHAIHPSVIDVSLLPAIRMLVRRHQDAFAITMVESEALREADLAGRNRLSPEVRLNVYRCVEQALDNVAQHARARSARIALDLRAEMFIGEVSDDGVGFEALNDHRGMGLHVTEVRIAALEGHFEITSTPGAGTRLRFELPLARPVKASA